MRVMSSEFDTPPLELDAFGADLWALHQYLIGLRRRHAWLHAASTTALRLDNRHYIYESRSGDDALLDTYYDGQHDQLTLKRLAGS